MHDDENILKIDDDKAAVTSQLTELDDSGLEPAISNKRVNKRNGLVVMAVFLVVILIGLIYFMYANPSAFNFIPRTTPPSGNIDSNSTAESKSGTYVPRIGTQATDNGQTVLANAVLISPLITAVCAVIGTLILFVLMFSLASLRGEVATINEKLNSNKR